MPVVPVLVGATLAMLAVTPALPVGVVGWLVLERTLWRTRWLTLAALVALAALLVPPWRASWLLLHVQGWQAVAEAWPWWWARLDTWQAVLVCEAPMGVPLGVLGAVIAHQAGGRRASGAPWEPVTIRQRDRAEAREARRISNRLDNPMAAAGCSAPPLAVARADGDLAAWREGDFVVMPRAMRGRALAVAGRPGMGKTVLLRRLVAADGAAGRRSVVVDCKGTEPRLAWELIEAWQAGAGYVPTYRLWGETSPLDGWQGDGRELANRLLAGQEWSEIWYKRVASRVVRLACAAPAGVPRSAEEFLGRLTATGLLEAYQGAGAEVLAEIQDLTRERGFAGVRLRYADYFDALAGRFDGDWTWSDGEVLFLRLPTLAEPEDAAGAFGFLLGDLAAYAVQRKARLGDDLHIVIDEFSAVAGARAAIDLAERLRDVGVMVTFVAQSWEGFGPPDLRERLLAACAALVVLGMDHPEPLLAAAGTRMVPEQSWSLDHHGPTGQARLGMVERPLVDPNAVRRAETGECWVLSGGRYLHGQVVRPSALPWPAPALRAAREAVEVVRVDGHQGGPGQALERRERPLVVPGDHVVTEALPAPRLALVARQLAARVQSGELELAGELATAFGLEAELAALVAAQREPVGLAKVLLALVRRWRP